MNFVQCTVFVSTAESYPNNLSSHQDNRLDTNAVIISVLHILAYSRNSCRLILKHDDKMSLPDLYSPSVCASLLTHTLDGCLAYGDPALGQANTLQFSFNLHKSVLHKRIQIRVNDFHTYSKIS